MRVFNIHRRSQSRRVLGYHVGAVGDQVKQEKAGSSGSQERRNRKSWDQLSDSMGPGLD